MGQSVSQHKKLDKAEDKNNLVLAILKGIQQLNDPPQVQERTSSQESLEDEEIPVGANLLVRENIRPRKKSWFYYDEQMKQQTKKHLPIKQKAPEKYKQDLLALCKIYDKKQVKDFLNKPTDLDTSVQIKQDEIDIKTLDSVKNLKKREKFNQDFVNYDIRQRDNTVNTLDMQFSPKLDFLQIPQNIKKEKKQPPKRFDTNLLEFCRNSNKKPKNNNLKRLSSSSDYQDLLQIMGTQKKMISKKNHDENKIQQKELKNKFQKDLLQLFSTKAQPVQVPTQQQLDSSIIFTNGSNHHIETTLSLVTSLTQKLLFLNLDQHNQSDHIQEDYISDDDDDDEDDESPTSAVSKDESVMTHNDQHFVRGGKRQTPESRQQTEHVQTFTLNSSPQRSPGRSKFNRSMTNNPTANFQYQETESQHSGNSNMKYL